MSLSTHNDFDRNAGVVDAERSLRLIASLPAPVGIEDRVKSGLRGTPIQTGVIGWPLSPNRAGWAQVSYLRAAAAAAIVLMVAGGGWGVYAHFGQAPSPAADVVPQRIDGGGFSSAEARRAPKTVEGPTIVVPKDGEAGNGCRQCFRGAARARRQPAEKAEQSIDSCCSGTGSSLRRTSRVYSSLIAARTSMPITASTTAPQKAGTHPYTMKPGTIFAASRIIPALTNSRKSPRERMARGG